jgi:hypothetical protein
VEVARRTRKLDGAHSPALVPRTACDRASGQVRVGLPVLVALAFAGTPGARAAEPDNATLQLEVKALREMVLDLQARVNRLEGAPPPTAQAAPPVTKAAPAVPEATLVAAPAVPAATPIAAAPLGANSEAANPEAALRANWSNVRREMDQGEVTRLLGAPSKKFTIDGRPVWYYFYPATGTGSVFFTEQGRVSSRQSPFGWGG